MGNKQIGLALNISPFTVSNHRKKIMSKTKGHSIQGAVNLAKSKGHL
jgi:DNA-binding CsgD family transcriptional regulator